MLKTIGFTTLALAGMLAFAVPQKADAASFGVYVGPPAYTYPASPYAYNPYVDPYACYNYPGYACPAPVYVGPSYGLGFGWGGGWGGYYGGGHGWRGGGYGHGFAGRGGFSGGHAFTGRGGGFGGHGGGHGRR